MDSDFNLDRLKLARDPPLMNLDPPHIARLKQQVNHNPLLYPQSLEQLAGRSPKPLPEIASAQQLREAPIGSSFLTPNEMHPNSVPQLPLARQIRGEVRTIENELKDYIVKTPKHEEIRQSLDQISLNNDQLAGGQRDLIQKSKNNTQTDYKTHENEDEVFDQILEHIIKNNDDLSNIKKFRRFRLQRQKDEEDELSRAERYKGALGKMRLFWDKTKQATQKYMPKSVR